MIADARRTVQRERRRTIDEREALGAFAGRVSELSVDSTDAGVQVGARFVTANTTSAVAAVREAYEQTVMAVPHYRTEYDDTYVESLTAEFGPTVATAATRPRLTSAARAGLVDAAKSARADRARFVEALDTEDQGLRAAGERLGELLAEAAELDTEPLDKLDFGSLDALRARLCVLEQHTEAVANTRQTALHDQHTDFSLSVPGMTLPEYLYQTCDTQYPVLSQVARTALVLKRIRDDVEWAIATV
jgi:hypothetical protein